MPPNIPKKFMFSLIHDRYLLSKCLPLRQMFADQKFTLHMFSAICRDIFHLHIQLFEKGSAYILSNRHSRCHKCISKCACAVTGRFEYKDRVKAWEGQMIDTWWRFSKSNNILLNRYLIATHYPASFFNTWSVQKEKVENPGQRTSLSRR